MKIEEQITDMIIDHAEEKLPSLLAIQELKFGNTAIHGAVICSNYKVLKKILINGYRFDSLKNLSHQNHKGNTPIHEAVNEAWRGPKILALVLSVAMADDLAIVNNEGETALQLAERLLEDANSIQTLVAKIEKAIEELDDFVFKPEDPEEIIQLVETNKIDVPAEIGLLLKAMRDLMDSDPLEDKFSDLSEEQKNLPASIDNFIVELEKYDVEGFVNQAREQLGKYEDSNDWLAKDAQQLIAKAISLDLQGVHIPEIQNAVDNSNVNQASLSQNDAESLAVSVRTIIDNYDQGKPIIDFTLDLADGLGSKAEALVESLKELEFFKESYIASLTNVKQRSFWVWKAKQLQLPRSFPNLETVDTRLLLTPNPPELIYNQAEQFYNDGLIKLNSGNYLEAIASLKESVGLLEPSYTGHLILAHAFYALANSYLALKNNFNRDDNLRLFDDNNENAQINLEKAIEIYLNLERYPDLEGAYQALAKTYIKTEFSIASYEEYNRDKLSLLSREELQGHLALAGLYKELQAQNFQSSAFSMADLQICESYHYHQVYKLTQGKLDNSAHVVLQREIGIANNANLGTYNIQQCVAVVAFDPLSKKVVLSHFDKSSGPVSFIEQLIQQFPGQTPIHLYISGGRDRFSPAATTIPSKISDNNIDLVLKQVYRKNAEDAVDGDPENGRFKIKACDVGDKSSPQGIVFDVQLQRLIHATPNLMDNSLESRAVNFLLQRVNEDYVRPLNSVDFRENEAERTINFTPEEQQKIRIQLRLILNYLIGYPLVFLELPMWH